MKQAIACVFGDALLYLALLIIVMAGVRAFGQTVVLKAVVRDGQIFLVPYQQVEIRVRTKDGSALPKTGESLHCKPKSVEVASKDGQKYRRTEFHCGDYRFEVLTWILAAQ